MSHTIALAESIKHTRPAAVNNTHINPLLKEAQNYYYYLLLFK